MENSWPVPSDSTSVVCSIGALFIFGIGCVPESHLREHPNEDIPCQGELVDDVCRPIDPTVLEGAPSAMAAWRTKIVYCVDDGADAVLWDTAWADPRQTIDDADCAGVAMDPITGQAYWAFRESALRGGVYDVDRPELVWLGFEPRALGVTSTHIVAASADPRGVAYGDRSSAATAPALAKNSAPDEGVPEAITVGPGGRICWSVPVKGEVLCMNSPDGGADVDAVANLAILQSGPYSLAVDGEDVFFPIGDKVYRAPGDVIDAEGAEPMSVVLDAHALYWIDRADGTVRRWDRATQATQTIASGLVLPILLVDDGRDLLILEQGTSVLWRLPKWMPVNRMH